MILKGQMIYFPTQNSEREDDFRAIKLIVNTGNTKRRGKNASLLFWLD